MMGLKTAAMAIALAGTTIVTSQAAAADTNCQSTSATEKVVREFFDLAFVRGQYREGIMRYIREDYIQHNPMAPDGRDAILALFASFPADKLPKVTLARVIAQCDVAAVHYKFEMTGIPALAIVDIFRVKDGKIAEHWDVSQSIPDKSANPHPMF